MDDCRYKQKKPDCIIFAGDATCDGDITVFEEFIKRMQDINIPFLFIPGNSDLRCKESCDKIIALNSSIENKIGNINIFAINDANAEISDHQLSAIENADQDSIVFMHHPISSLHPQSSEKMLQWRESHPQTLIVYGHLHESKIEDYNISLQALDPDKAINECPCITYYDTEKKEIKKAYYFSPVPNDIYKFFGVSCYDVVEHIEFCIKKGLKYLELRPNCINVDKDALYSLICKWREIGGKDLCIHLPDVKYNDGEVKTENIDKYIELAKLLHVNRFTQHVPCISVATVKSKTNALEQICDYLSQKFNAIEHKMVIGVENMHMTAKENVDDSRRYGYIPEECIHFMKLLDKRCSHKVGINFDIGHALNNIPFSQKYQISTWLSQIGKYAVGYHIHQVTLENGKFVNHTPITDIYGKFINFSSFLKNWHNGSINKAPVIFEMRPEGSYVTTLDTFEKHKTRKVFDIHTHTYYSNCGRDEPKDLIKKAIEHGISLLGISDHNYGIGNKKEEYLKHIRALACEYKNNIKILCGIEIATLPNLYDLVSPKEIEHYDYCLLENIDNMDSIARDDLFIFCKELGILCGIAHTNLFDYCDSRNYDYNEFFSKMAENNIFWEMNLSYDSIHKYNEHKYVLEFIKDNKKIDIIKNTGVVVSIGSDCHRCEEYNGFSLYQMYDFLKEKNIKTFEELF